MGKIVVAFLAAVLAGHVVGAIFFTQFNLGALVELGAPIDLVIRARTTMQDIVGMFPVYTIAVAVALFLGFSIAGIIVKRLPQLRYLGFISAGFVGFYAMHGLIEALAGVNLFWIAKTSMGILFQAIAGAIGGYVFVTIRDKQLRDHLDG